jgi:hypothetical protein
MKTLTILTILIAFSISCHAQVQKEKFLYLAKAEKYRKMKTTGQILTFAGSAMFVTGIVLMANSAEQSVSQSGQTPSSGSFGAGVAVYLLGIGGVGAGVPLWIIGGVNKGRYERKLESVSVRLNVSQQNTGFAIRYKL